MSIQPSKLCLLASCAFLALNLSAPLEAQLGLLGSFFLQRSVEPHEQDSRHGEAVAILDLDGDGINEVASGQPSWDGDPDSAAGLLANRGQVVIQFRPIQISRGIGGNTTITIDGCTNGGPGEDGLGVGFQMGAALSAGDYNDDGYGDLAIGMPGALTDDEREGAVCVVYGQPTRDPEEFIYQRISKPGTATEENGDRPAFGSVLHTANLDRDRYDDLLIGAPGADVRRGLIGPEESDVGAAQLIYGSTVGLFSGRSTRLATTDLESGSGIGFVRRDDHFGVSFAVGDYLTDDVRGDEGHLDLMVGAMAADGSGRLYGFSGQKNGELNILPTEISSDELIGTRNPGDEFARSLAAGDFNGDGEDDLAIGIPGDNDLAIASEAGAVMVLYGSLDSLTAQDQQLLFESVLDGHQDGVTAFDRFGEVLAAGDFDANGFDDLVIGTPLDNPFDVANAGEVTGLYGQTAGFSVNAVQVWNGIFFQNGLEVGDEFGSALATGSYGHVLDIDDLIVGVPDKSFGRGAQNPGYTLVINAQPLFADGFESGDTSRWSSTPP